jgi:hypothetical protein
LYAARNVLAVIKLSGINWLTAMAGPVIKTKFFRRKIPHMLLKC